MVTLCLFFASNLVPVTEDHSYPAVQLDCSCKQQSLLPEKSLVLAYAHRQYTTSSVGNEELPLHLEH